MTNLKRKEYKMASQQNRMSPRQKMINLMYVVLMAMLALNVSSDVLNGFSLVEDSLLRTTANATATNETLYKDLRQQMEDNPAKVKEWFDKAQYVKRISDSLYNYAEELKVRIVKQADGEDGDVKNVENKEDLEAASAVMLAPRRGEGERLYRSINSFRERIVEMLTDEAQKKIIADNLSTEVPKKAGTLGKNWQEYMFENMPVAAAVTLLSKLQSDVRYAEGEVLHSLVSNIDIKDLRVNELNAYVIPNSRTIVQGGKLSAQIIMAAVDTTKRPAIYVGGRQVASPDGVYEMVCGRTGDFSQRPREISFQMRSATRASTSPSLTIRRASRIVSGATENSGNFAAKRARRRIRTGSSAKAGLTCRKMRALRSLWPPQGSMSTPSEDRAMALMVKSRRLRSSSSETSGLA